LILGISKAYLSIGPDAAWKLCYYNFKKNLKDHCTKFQVQSFIPSLIKKEWHLQLS